jgi:hypothetical protein
MSSAHDRLAQLRQALAEQRAREDRLRSELAAAQNALHVAVTDMKEAYAEEDEKAQERQRKRCVEAEDRLADLSNASPARRFASSVPRMRSTPSSERRLPSCYANGSVLLSKPPRRLSGTSTRPSAVSVSYGRTARRFNSSSTCSSPATVKSTDRLPPSPLNANSAPSNGRLGTAVRLIPRWGGRQWRQREDKVARELKWGRKKREGVEAA